MLFSPKFRRATAVAMAAWLLCITSVSFFVLVLPAHAGDAPSSLPAGIVQVSTAGCRGASTAVTPDLCEGANEAANQVDDKLIKPAMQVALLTALLNLATFVFDRLAYEAAIWVATGGQGETPLFNTKTASDAWKDFGLDIAGDAIGELNSTVLDQLNVDFDICAPENPLFKLSIQLGLKQVYEPQQPKCDFQDVRKNWDSFLATTFEQEVNPSQAVLKVFAQGFKPGQNELSATIGLNLKVQQQVLEKKTNNLFEQVNSGGFKAVTDVVTGQVKTPSSVLQNEFQRQIANANEEPTKLQVQAAIQNADLLGNMFLHVAGVFTNTLLSTLMNRVYTGLFDVQPDSDPLNGEVASVPDRNDAANRFASLITAAPTQVDNYNVLSEFLACPVGNVAVRNVNNCVMDSSLVSAVARAESGAPLTVQEAVDEGLLHGDWPLIPHEGDGIPKNQDPLCYTYGYCYGNLVKMRKARIVPVGWEIAASRNDASNPATLQEIINGFDDCGDQAGGIDSTHKWCHLIDPNWVLKYPETQCRALVNGELLISTLSGGRAGACVDTPSCISEANDGSCDGGFGYCAQEKNVWRFRGEECPEEYASCMSFKNTDSGDSANYLYNTLDDSYCTADNAGCEWYRTAKHEDDGGTVDDTSDDAYEWLPGDESFVSADRADDVLLFDTSTGANTEPTTYRYVTTGGSPDGYDTYAYQDRIYFNNNVEECAEEAAGCSAVYPINDSLVLNVVQNSSFETDDNGDGQPDGWESLTASGTLDTAGSYSEFGANAYSTGSGTLTQTGIALAAGNFYTLSFYGRQAASGGSDSVSGRVILTDQDGNDLDLAGTSTSGCSVDDWSTGTNNSVLLGPETPEGTDQERFSCTFTVPDNGNGAVAQIILDSNGGYVDAVQLELGEDASSYTETYNNSSPAASYLLLPPDYLGCTGAATDPSECDSYTQICTAQDVGCNLYTPDDGDPSVPAIAEALDECPSECVGYTTYKQEATDRESEDFPLYFIADRATSCSAQYVGCDAFTNLDASESGGEDSESYTYLRTCMKPDMASGSTDTNMSSTYFTWEGSDAAGYQLVTWTLLESNQSDSSTLTFDGSGNVEHGVGLAPCVSWEAASENTLVCNEDSSTRADIAANGDCDEHDDIFDNPDCREFYDRDGNIHYRDVTQTVAVSEDCHPYRYAGSTRDNCEASGGFWTAAGDCRYFGLPDESTECPAAQAGCRAYTGGAGRNALTVFSDDFEDGNITEYTDGGSASSSISNESVATDGHSMRVTTGSGIGIVSTAWYYLDSSSSPDASVTYDESDSATCTDEGWTVASDGNCEIDADGDGTVECEVTDGDNGCGTLNNELVAGKTYVLSFWAKGSGDIKVYLSDRGGTGDDHDLVDPSTPDTLDGLTLDGGWQAYELGPLDTGEFDAFSDDAVLVFGTGPGETFYVDNVQLKAVEENVTIIKDSWVVPSTCDQTPGGADSPQYYLGCEAYTDQNGDDADLYQFSDICSEDVVGCEAVYDTQNSDSPYGKIYNARCAYVSDDTTDDDTVSSNTGCLVDGETVCTISAGDSYCLFDRDGSVPAPMPYEAATDGAFYMELGPEAAVVPDDRPMYLVDNGTTDCDAENVGCEEVGLPTYNQDKTEVTGFTSTYLLNDPDSYGDTLCENRELFCEEWSSTKDGNFYFKDPVDQTCEYQNDITVDGVSYSGWFRTGTTEPCDEDYLISGQQYGIWHNGDDAFAGWAGTCSSSYDLCTEFRDESDASEGTYPSGTPYYFLDDDSLSEEALTASQQCDGQVSQKEGCALFNDTTDSSASYNTSASYMASTHADALFGDAPESKQDPVSCDGGGSAITTPDGESVNLCQRRCSYTLSIDDALSRPDAEEGSAGLTTPLRVPWYDASCYDDSDCPDLSTDNGTTVSGTCTDGLEDYPLQNDANRVIKVYRDRECAAWLSCQSAQVSWNERTSRYETICDKIGLCTRYTSTGDTSFCTEWADTDPEVLNASEYAGRDVTWNGREYSGYSIPNQLPIDQYDQVNIAPSTGSTICANRSDEPQITDGSFVECETTDDCGILYPRCVSFAQDFRLGYDAGPCDMGDAGWGGSCVVGSCENSGDSCSSDDDCATGDSCVVGYCQYIDSSVSSCTNDSQCTTSGYGTCDTTLAKCVNELAPNDSPCVTSDDCSSTSGGQCTPTASAKTGACYNNACLTDIEGDPISDRTAREAECRGYPEATSPFPSEVVQSGDGWVQPDGTAEDEPSELDSQPYAYSYGFQSVDVCAPYDTDGDGVVEQNDDCLCSYTKASYGTAAETRYYPTDASDSNILQGVCIGGDNAGAECSKDGGECGGQGTCAVLTRKDTLLGWDGYCLEKDTSIQLYGSSDEENRACLTWLPVDQLAGSTDLYGKYVEAGYPAEDTYYCAEIEDTYDLKVGNNDDDEPGAACAETGTGRCYDFDVTTGDGDDDGSPWDDFAKKDNLDGSCLESVWCPDGYFAVMTGCGGLSHVDGSDDKSCDTGGDDDCPFFCVPKGSYKTYQNSELADVGIENNVGEPCLPPTLLQDEKNLNTSSTLSVKSGSVFGDGVATAAELNELFGTDRVYPTGISSVSYDDGAPGFDVYLIRDRNVGPKNATFNDILEFYDDCETRGLVGDTVKDFVYPFDTAADLLATPEKETGSKKAYRNLKFSIDNYAACTGLVQVSDDTADSNGNYNYAWTDRTWTDGAGYAVQDADGRFAYETGTEQSVFGRATNVDTFTKDVESDVTSDSYVGDLYPLHAVMCSTGTDRTGTEQTVVGVEGSSCEDGALTSSTGDDAQPYYDVVVNGEVAYSPIAGTAAEAFCEDSDGDTSTDTATEVFSSCASSSTTECSCDEAGDLSECNVGIVCADTDGDGSGDTCDGDGPNDGASCETDSDCYAYVCKKVGRYTYTDSCGGSDVSPTPTYVCATLDSAGSASETVDFGERETTEDAVNRLRQIFAHAMNVWFYRDGFYDGTASYSGRTSTKDLLVADSADNYDWVFGGLDSYQNYNDLSGSGSLEGDESSRFGEWDGWDYTDQGDPDVSAPKSPSPPTVVSVGTCDGTHCEEDKEDAFSVDGLSSGVIAGSDGYEHVSVSFFAYADEDQLPIRQVLVNWGDGNDFGSGLAWPTDSYSGSTADTNYYKNHRGYDVDDQSLCTDDDWGTSPSACDASYITFIHDYVCTAGDVSDLSDSGRECEYASDGSGRLLNSPCLGTGTIGTAGACVYQPRVFVKDNWGWCAGTCDAGDDGTSSCYKDECDPMQCPSTQNNGEPNSGSSCLDSDGEKTVNPWINYDGYVEVTP